MPGVYCIAVSDVLKHVASGISQENVLRDFPDLRTEHIRAILICLIFMPSSRLLLMIISVLSCHCFLPFSFQVPATFARLA
jgi:hypothetical protein